MQSRPRLTEPRDAHPEVARPRRVVATPTATDSRRPSPSSISRSSHTRAGGLTIDRSIQIASRGHARRADAARPRRSTVVGAAAAVTARAGRVLLKAAMKRSISSRRAAFDRAAAPGPLSAGPACSRPRCSAAFTAPTLVARIVAISSRLKSNTSLSTTAARSCGAVRSNNAAPAARVTIASTWPAASSAAWPSSPIAPRRRQALGVDPGVGRGAAEIGAGVEERFDRRRSRSPWPIAPKARSRVSCARSSASKIEPVSRRQ